jgi:hypothetical protein
MADQIATITDIEEDVYRTLGPGFSEDVYDRVMQGGLRLANTKTAVRCLCAWDQELGLTKAGF